MSALDEPQYVTFQFVATSEGLKAELSANCLPCLFTGQDNGDRYTIAHRTRDYLNAITDDRDGSRYLSYYPDFDPTWYGTYRALRTGMIHRVGAYSVRLPPTPAPMGTPTPAPPPTSLHTIALETVIGPGIYNVAGRGDARCPNGDPGYALHLWSREHNPQHQLSDVIVDEPSLRFCMMRMALNGPGPFGGNAIWEEHFGQVGPYWMVTDGYVEGTLRVLGVAASHGIWRYRLANMQFPSALPAGTFSKPQDAAAFDPAPYMHADRLVDIGGRRLNLYCTGSGSPTVLLDAGGGDDILDWRLVQPMLAKTTRVCSYDRAGFGFSDPAPLPRDADALADDLHALVTAAPIARPFVLVGYSQSTISARIYADRYPGDLAGLVLLGPDIEDRQAGLFAAAPAVKPIFDRVAAIDKMCEHAEDGGVLQPHTNLYDACVGAPNPALPPALAAVQTQQFLRPAAWKDRFSENDLDSAVSTREVRAAQRDYGALPLAIVTAEDVFPPGSYMPEAQRRAERAYVDGIRAKLATYSTASSRTTIPDCSHEDITLNCAPAVTSAIEKIVVQGRGQNRPS